MGLIYAAILLGVLIFVHELGHFLVAKACGVKVERFSIGFGPKVVGFTYGETEYVICWLPLGGYVKMLGFEMDELDEIPEDERDRALMMQPIWQRSLITLAGPAANFVLPMIIYFVFSMGQATVPAAVVGEVFAETPAAHVGLKAGDHITNVDGHPITYWHELTEVMQDTYDRTVDLTYTRDGTSHTVRIKPEKKTRTDYLGLNERTFGMLGIHLQPYGTTLGISDPASPAAKAGLHTFDKVVSVNGEHITRFDELESKIRQSGGKPLELSVLRRQPIDTDYAHFYSQRVITVRAVPQKVDGTYTLGIDDAEMYLSKVKKGSPAAKAGLHTGDKLLTLDGHTFSNMSMLDQRITNDANEAIVAAQKKDPDKVDVKLSYKLTYLHDGQPRTTTLRPEIQHFAGQSKTETYRVYIGWQHLADRLKPDEIDFPFFQRLAYSANNGVENTKNWCEMTLMGYVRMAQGRVSSKSLGGPIMIGQLAAQAGEAGFGPFVQMMALISINLGLINLFPIPVLDGGHLVLYAMEGVKRGPLSFRTRQIAAYVGIALIVFLMIFAFKNDIERNWDTIAKWINSI